MVLHLKKKLEFPSSKDALCQIWLKLTKRFWRRNEKVMPLRILEMSKLLLASIVEMCLARLKFQIWNDRMTDISFVHFV